MEMIQNNRIRCLVRNKIKHRFLAEADKSDIDSQADNADIDSQADNADIDSQADNANIDVVCAAQI
jgi:hypothetical protein